MVAKGIKKHKNGMPRTALRGAAEGHVAHPGTIDMKRFRITDLDCGGSDHILKDVIPGKYLLQGGLSFKRPGRRSQWPPVTSSSVNREKTIISSQTRQIRV